MLRILFLIIPICHAVYGFAGLPELVPYRSGDLWGYADTSGKIRIQPQYQSAELFSDGQAIVSKGGRKGVVDTSGKIVLPFRYNILRSSGLRGYWVAAVLGNKAGLIDSIGRFCISPAYDEIVALDRSFFGVFSDSFRIVELNSSKVIWTCVLSALTDLPVPVPEYSGFILDSLGYKGFITNSGEKKIAVAQERIYYHPCGFLISESSRSKILYNTKWKRKKRIPRECRKYRAVYPAETCIPAFELIPGKKSIANWTLATDSSQVTKKWGWRSSVDSAWLCMPRFDSVGYFYKGFAIIRVDGKLGVVNRSFDLVIDPQYDVLVPKSEGLFWVMRKPRVTFEKSPDLRIFMGYVDIHGREYWDDEPVGSPSILPGNEPE